GGVGDLLEIVTKDFGYVEKEEIPENIRIAIVGKPNVGKSSIVNALLNKERVIVSDVSGTTRDSIDSKVKYEGEEFILVDTAGIRKKSKVDWGIEKFAVDRSIRAIRNCDVAILVIDATEGISEQDKKIAGTIVDAGKALVLAINKWDLIEDKQSSTINKFEKQIETDIPFLSYVPKLFISAKTKQRLVNIYKLSKEVYAENSKRVTTSLLNKVIMDAVSMNPPTSIRGKRLKIFYVTQVKANPPTFVLFINNEDLLKDNYTKYLENKLREAFGFKGSPIKISAKEKGEKK
ncbi:ribosome biogenesis GTPase Der, partial [bacterium]|nr:ribosome biogenesis GTPase Der [bacterium]